MPKVHSARVSKDFPVSTQAFAKEFFYGDASNDIAMKFHETVRGDRKISISAWDNDMRTLSYKPDVKLLGKVKVSMYMTETQKRGFSGKAFFLDQVIQSDALGVETKIKCHWTVEDLNEPAGKKKSCHVLVDVKVKMMGNLLLVNEEARERTLTQVKRMQEAWLDNATARLTNTSPTHVKTPVTIPLIMMAEEADTSSSASISSSISSSSSSSSSHGAATSTNSLQRKTLITLAVIATCLAVLPWTLYFVFGSSQNSSPRVSDLQNVDMLDEESARILSAFLTVSLDKLEASLRALETTQQMQTSQLTLASEQLACAALSA